AHRRRAEALVGVVAGLEAAQESTVADDRADLAAAALADALDHRVGFRMHGAGIERVVAAGNAQKAGALLDRLRSQSRHLEQRLAALVGAVFVAVLDHVVGDTGAQAGHARQQRRRGGIDIHADAVDAVFHARVQRARQLDLVDVVLVLADADGLGFDLDQLGQRVLQAPGNRPRAAPAGVQPRT